MNNIVSKILNDYDDYSYNIYLYHYFIFKDKMYLLFLIEIKGYSYLNIINVFHFYSVNHFIFIL